MDKKKLLIVGGMIALTAGLLLLFLKAKAKSNTNEIPSDNPSDNLTDVNKGGSPRLSLPPIPPSIQTKEQLMDYFFNYIMQYKEGSYDINYKRYAEIAQDLKDFTFEEAKLWYECNDEKAYREKTMPPETYRKCIELSAKYPAAFS